MFQVIFRGRIASFSKKNTISLNVSCQPLDTSHNWNIRSDIWLAYHMAYHIT